MSTSARLLLHKWRGTIGLVFLANAAYVGKEAYDLVELQRLETKDGKKKYALTIDFDQLDLVESNSPKNNIRKRLVRRLMNDKDSSSSANESITMSVSELVHVIHTAAQDPHVCALFGRFKGSGTGSNSNWADWEEVRNALTVFAQSHRRHYEPKVTTYEEPTATTNDEPEAPTDDETKGATDDETKATSTEPEKPQDEEVKEESPPPVCAIVEKKPLYCFADNLGNMAVPGNPQYYLASAFSHVHLQSNGELQLFGLLKTSFFLRGFLEKHGIQFHVLKHGDYKTAPNTLTETNFTRAHKESTFNLVAELDADVCLDITKSRAKALMNSWLKGGGSNGGRRGNGSNGGGASKNKLTADNFKILQIWQRIHEAGTFPAITAFKGGLVDFLTRRDPLQDLVAYNQAKEKGDQELAASIKGRWDECETSFDDFKATKSVSLEEYQTHLYRVEKLKSKRDKWANLFFRTFGDLVGMPNILMPLDGSPVLAGKERERVAVLNVIGLIDDAKANDIVAQLRSLQKSLDDNDETGKKKDQTKALVMRVVSPGGHIIACEKISQELRALHIPLVVSFGNVAASGGYYISAFADRIFGSHKTITGSIGVFGMRADLTGLAHKYGIRAEHVAAGNLAATFSAFAPLTKPMHQDMSASVDRWYEQFKDVVQQGRSLKDIEEFAQGKVWTGRQAQGVGLLDEIGGYERALAYAKRTYCENPELVELVALDEPESFWKRLMKFAQGGDLTVWQDVRHFLFDDFTSDFGKNNVNLEPDSPQAALDDFGQWLLRSPNAVAPGTVVSGIYMTSDENTAVQALFRDSRFRHRGN